MPLARSLSSMGVSLYYQKKDTEALTYYNEALSIADEVGDSYGALINVINAGFSHVNLGNNELAMEMFESAHSRAVTLDEKQAQGVSMGGIAHLLRLRGDLDEALSKFEGCLALTIEIKNTTGEIEARHYLGLTHQDLGNKAAAREQFEVALRIAEEYGDRRIEELRGRLAHLEDRRG